MIVLFTVLRLLAILIVSHDMSGLLKTWKSKCWFIAGISCSLYLLRHYRVALSTFVLLSFLKLKYQVSEKNSFLFTFLPWVFC